MEIKKLIEALDKELSKEPELYLSVEPIDGGFLPNTDIEYNAQIILYKDGEKKDSIMIPYEEQTDKDIIAIAKDHFGDLPDDIKVEWY